jgi:hypothetical protein
MQLPEDVVNWIRNHFSDAEEPAALEILRDASIHTSEAASPRLLRCAAISSQGNLRRLEEAVQHLRIDWRDVILAAEYRPSGRSFEGSLNYKRVFDFNKPIGEAAVADDRT